MVTVWRQRHGPEQNFGTTGAQPLAKRA